MDTCKLSRESDKKLWGREGKGRGGNLRLTNISVRWQS